MSICTNTHFSDFNSGLCQEYSSTLACFGTIMGFGSFIKCCTYGTQAHKYGNLPLTQAVFYTCPHLFRLIIASFRSHGARTSLSRHHPTNELAPFGGHLPYASLQDPAGDSLPLFHGEMCHQPKGYHRCLQLLARNKPCKEELVMVVAMAGSADVVTVVTVVTVASHNNDLSTRSFLSQ
jgi:hypothetical protein